MKTKRIEHIGIAVSDLTESVHYYEEVLGLRCYRIEDVPDQKVRIAFFRVGECKIELLESTDPEGTISKFIDKKGEGIHHIAFAVENIGCCLEEAESKGISLIDKSPRPGAEGLQIAFLHPRSTFSVLTELCEDKSAG